MVSNTDQPICILELEKQFSYVDDVNDPTSMITIITRLEQLQAQDEEFFRLLLEKLPEMTVTWPQPWYQHSTSLTRPMKELTHPNSKDTYRADTICYDESNKIHENWEAFVKIYEIPDTPECLARWRNKGKFRSSNSPEEQVRRFVVSFLAQGLQRTLYQVYKHVIIRYGSPVKGLYLKYEENIVDIYLRHSSRNCSQHCVPDLSAILGREPRGLYKMLIQKIEGAKERKQIMWTIPKATKFLNLLLKYSNEKLDDLKNRRIEKSVWLKLEEELGQNYIALQMFWYRYLHVQLFVKYDVKIRKLRRHTLKRLRHYPYKVWGDIRWKELLKELPDGFTHLFLYRTCVQLFSHYPRYRKDPIADLINYGLKKTKCIRNRRLKTLKLNENKELEIVKYEKKIFG